MKFHILNSLIDGPYGGGNQFLKALKKELENQNAYSDTHQAADCLIANVNPTAIPELINKIANNQKPVIARIDGPISLVRGKDKYIDYLIKEFITLYADGIVFQSKWSKKENEKIFNITHQNSTIISNAADSRIFFPSNNHHSNHKIKIITTSWSGNPRKGFQIYQYLDNNLDFSKYDMTFVGNTTVDFKNIKIIKPLHSNELANILRQHDMYITASKNDPCSNSLIEALSCGLPAIALNSGGHPELIGSQGELFKGQKDILEIINRVSKNLDKNIYKKADHSIQKVSQDYLSFANQTTKQKHLTPPKLVQKKLLLKYRLYQLSKIFL
ncbi:MAG: glycosyltransferase [bacterium]|nr:glycosyltransferase [bacterium]